MRVVKQLLCDACYNIKNMLEAIIQHGTPFPRLYIKGIPAIAWIEHKPWRPGGQWELWIERNGRLSRAKCQLQLEIESRLRAWLLRTVHLPLRALTFDELRLIAEGDCQKVRQAHRRGALH